jgi:glycosyltransferase involved in cell wall biosynthesis
MKTIACVAPYGSGGLGRHLSEIVEFARQEGELARYYTQSAQLQDPSGCSVALPILAPLFTYTPIRFSPGWQNYLNAEIFDRAVAAQLHPGQMFIGFNGQALHCFRRAQLLQYSRFGLVSANSHALNVSAQHKKALFQYPFESSWLNLTHQRKMLQEYEVADVIYVASAYTRQSFIKAGTAEQKLQSFTFRPSERFQPAPSSPSDGVFRVVYSGSLTVVKGIPILLEAFSRLSGKAELTLVGNSSTRGMRIYLQDWLRRDSRIRIAPGDPLPHLQKANVYVHPSFEDGFAYAPMEALACNIPVIVTEDTGMKEHIQSKVNGYIVPTGDWAAILDYLQLVQKSLQS